MSILQVYEENHLLLLTIWQLCNEALALCSTDDKHGTQEKNRHPKGGKICISVQAELMAWSILEKGSRQENNEGIELIISRKGQKHFEGKMMDIQWLMNAVQE